MTLLNVDLIYRAVDSAAFESWPLASVSRQCAVWVLVRSCDLSLARLVPMNRSVITDLPQLKVADFPKDFAVNSMIYSLPG